VLKCHHCGEEWTKDPRPGFHAVCPRCEAHVYVCLNCRFYDRAASSGCQLPNTEPVRDKARPCFCEEFRFVDRPADWTPDAEKPKSESAKEKFRRLFRDP
jgi:hypothetical protein